MCSSTKLKKNHLIQEKTKSTKLRNEKHPVTSVTPVTRYVSVYRDSRLIIYILLIYYIYPTLKKQKHVG